MRFTCPGLSLWLCPWHILWEVKTHTLIWWYYHQLNHNYRQDVNISSQLIYLHLSYLVSDPFREKDILHCNLFHLLDTKHWFEYSTIPYRRFPKWERPPHTHPHQCLIQAGSICLNIYTQTCYKINYFFNYNKFWNLQNFPDKHDTKGMQLSRELSHQFCF